MWMMAGDDIPLLRLCQMKVAALGSGDHGEDPRRHATKFRSRRL
jgi:hypothetical protein